MEWTQVLGFMMVAVLLVVSPGPNGLLIAKTVPVAGKVAGFTNIAGFVAAFFVHGSLSILGISILLVQSGEAFFIFKMAGAAYLFWLGVKALLASRKSAVSEAESNQPEKQSVSLMTSFSEGFLTNALNPKVSVFYLAAFPQFIPVEGALGAAYFLVFLHALMNAMWFSALVVLLSRARKVAVSVRFRRWLNSITGVVFIGFSVKLASLRM